MNSFFGSANTSKDNANSKLVVVTERCPQNHPCPSVKVCPVGALVQNGYNAPVVDADRCVLCGKCVKTCPKKALMIE